MANGVKYPFLFRDAANIILTFFHIRGSRPGDGGILIDCSENGVNKAAIQMGGNVISMSEQVIIGPGAVDPSSSLQFGENPTKGFLLPRITTVQRDAIVTPATGLQIFNLTTNQPEYFDGTVWKVMGGADTNFANTDLTFNGNRTHDLGNNTLIIKNDPGNYFLIDPVHIQIFRKDAYGTAAMFASPAGFSLVTAKNTDLDQPFYMVSTVQAGIDATNPERNIAFITRLQMIMKYPRRPLILTAPLQFQQARPH